MSNAFEKIEDKEMAQPEEPEYEELELKESKIEAAKQKVFEVFRGKRGKILKKVFDVVLNAAPVTDFAKMAYEGYTGKTLISHEQLSEKERMIYLAIAAGTALAWSLYAAHMKKEFAMAKIGSSAAFNVFFAVKYTRDAIEWAKSSPKVAILLDKTADFIESKKEGVIKIFEKVKKGILPNPIYESEEE